LNTLQTSGMAFLLAFGAALFAVSCTPLPDRLTASGSGQPNAALSVSVTQSDVSSSEASSTAELSGSASSAGEDVQVINRGLIYLDPGHQRKGDSRQEPVSPGSHVNKARVTGGTKGVSTGKPEYVLNLELSVLLKEALLHKGFTVLMTREEHDVNLSNIERAEMANEANARLVVRIHADGNASPKAKGFSVLYPDPSVTATRQIQPESKQAAEFIHEALKAGTGASSRGLQPRKDLTGFNWSKVPVVLVEAGFMTNPAEDESLSDPDYQKRLAESVAEGIHSYMKQKEE